MVKVAVLYSRASDSRVTETTFPCYDNSVTTLAAELKIRSHWTARDSCIRAKTPLQAFCPEFVPYSQETLLNTNGIYSLGTQRLALLPRTPLVLI